MTSLSVVFPKENEVGLRTLSVFIHLFGCSVLSYCFAVRTTKEDLTSWRGLSSIPFARWLIIGIFFDSWLFIFTAGCLINGIGMSLNHSSCEAGVFLCICLYAVSKVLIYLFLIEKVYIVWRVRGAGRLASPAYRVCLLSMSGYAVILFLMIFGRIAYQKEDGSCIIGLGTLSSLSLLIYDLSLNVFLTGMFLWPLRKQNHLPTSLRLVARRTLIAACVALITSAINIIVLTILHGQELGWLCLGSCGADTTINALAIFWVTGGVTDQHGPGGGQGSETSYGGGGLEGGVSVAEQNAMARRPVSSPTMSTFKRSTITDSTTSSFGNALGMGSKHSSRHTDSRFGTESRYGIESKSGLDSKHSSRHIESVYDPRPKSIPTSRGSLVPARASPSLTSFPSETAAAQARMEAAKPWPVGTDYPRPGTAEDVSSTQRTEVGPPGGGRDVEGGGGGGESRSMIQRISEVLGFRSAAEENETETLSVQVTVTRTRTESIISHEDPPPPTTARRPHPHSRHHSFHRATIMEDPEHGITMRR